MCYLNVVGNESFGDGNPFISRFFFLFFGPFFFLVESYGCGRVLATLGRTACMREGERERGKDERGRRRESGREKC